METSPTAERPETAAPQRHGRRARPLTPEEQAELDAKRAEYERIHGPIGDADSREESGATDDAEGDPAAAGDGRSADGGAESSAALRPGQHVDPTAQPATPTLRRFGRRARIVEVEDEPTGEVPSADGTTPGTPADATAGDPAAEGAPARIPTDADGVELGEIPVGDAPDPRPAPRFEGRVLHRPERSGGSPVLWIVWVLVALALITLVILLVTGVIGGDSTQALALPVLDDGLPAPVSPYTAPTQEVVLA